MNENEAVLFIKSVCNLHINNYEVVRVQSDAIDGNYAQYIATYAVIAQQESITQALIAEFLKSYTESGGYVRFLSTKKDIDNLRSDILLLEVKIDAHKL